MRGVSGSELLHPKIGFWAFDWMEMDVAFLWLAACCGEFIYYIRIWLRWYGCLDCLM